MKADVVRSIPAFLVASALSAVLVMVGTDVLTLVAHADQADPPSQELMGADQKQPTLKEPGKGVQNHEAQKETLCLTIESAARANNLPLAFFARIIWQESRLQSNAVGPMTRTGQRAQGIAQFMPDTAKERRLLDPFDPVQALPKAAEFLSELRNRFGNLGLAAAAYNAGPGRVHAWLGGSAHMPDETRSYVLAITGTSIDDWAKQVGQNDKVPNGEPRTTCPELIALLERAPNGFVARLEQRVTRGAARPWGVQVATGFNRDDALAMYASAMRRLRGVIGNQDDPLLLRVHGTSSFFQVRIGANTQREADDICRRIQRAGGACLVKRRGA